VQLKELATILSLTYVQVLVVYMVQSQKLLIK